MLERLIVGLGNPGLAYQMTRHNVGFKVIQALGSKWGISFKEERKFQGLLGVHQFQETKVFLLMPTTYMNLSGESLQKVQAFFKINLEDILVVADDVAIPFGEIRLRKGGSAGGHNGLLSVEQHLGTRDYPRLRVGVGGPGNKALEAYVLERFMAHEAKELPHLQDRCLEAIDLWLQKGIDVAMNKVNVKLTSGEGKPGPEKKVSQLSSKLKDSPIQGEEKQNGTDKAESL